MIKELLFLIKLLFTKIPLSLDIVKLKYFPFKGYTAMMWCGKLITREDNIPYTTKTHELIHLRQAQVKGSWFKYYMSYVMEWIQHFSGTKAAYYTNPYEMEAYANEGNYEYTKNYNPDNINKYRIYNAVEKFKSCSNMREWFNFIKTL